MKLIKLLASTALVASSISPLAVSPAYADTIPEPVADAADSTTLAAMQTQCTALALAHDVDGIGTGDIWTGEVVEGDVTKVSGPTEVAGTRVIDTSSIVGTGTFTPGVTYIEGQPFRIGGSVNMFGDQYATSGSWSDSTYNYTADFSSTFAHAFTCDILQSVYHAPEHHRAVGKYVIYNDYNGNDEDAVRANCEQQEDHGQSWWGDLYIPNDNNPHCQFEGTAAYDSPEKWDDPVVVGNEPGIAVNQDQTDSLDAFEDHGGPVQASGGPFHIGQVVICISPSKPTPGGTWRQQNGYTGPNCTTDWFKNHAVWGSGTESSNGTYISVPNYSI